MIESVGEAYWNWFMMYRQFSVGSSIVWMVSCVLNRAGTFPSSGVDIVNEHHCPGKSPNMADAEWSDVNAK